ncbi:DNA repair protein rad2 [Serendipita sp. 401]|nr:DNA repair protein rad2 [Serendipita sp. 401]KAG9053356.1 DNA repair protein rad2 [Serendipita sp. 407]
MGVKQLWTLLSPVGRPVLLETMEGKALAIDSSIWIYQFQATMRDKEGKGLNNAHILGFLRRICKLLFYGIKPVFVFDGGAPALKRSTIVERKRRKAGAAQSHAKVAERLLAAQLRKEALSHVRKKRQPITNGNHTGTGDTHGGKKRLLGEDTVYMEDLLPPVTPSPKKPVQEVPKDAEPPESPKKYEWRDHDPYKLPAVDMQAKVAAATKVIDEEGGIHRVDPRLATEEELRQFIETMRPEDFDATSPAFRELPTEVQYEIIGDLRLKSRQTSHVRLQKMLKTSRTAMDFSKAQIRNLHDRNRLTQDLLMTTNSMGKEVDHHIKIQVRVAAERNREYVLIRNDGPTGGWSLSIRDQGTKEKPIHVQPDSDDDEDMEEVAINEPPLHYTQSMDRPRMALASIGKAQPSPSKADDDVPSVPSQRPEPLFMPEKEREDDDPDDQEFQLDLDAAIQESWKEQEDRDLEVALATSRAFVRPDMALQTEGAGPSRVPSYAISQNNRFPAEATPQEMDKNTPLNDISFHTDSGQATSQAESSRHVSTLETFVDPSNPFVTTTSTISAGVSSPRDFSTSNFFSASPPTSPKLTPVKQEDSTSNLISKSIPITGSSPVKPIEILSNPSSPIIKEQSSDINDKRSQEVEVKSNAMDYEEDEDEDDGDMIEEDLGFGLDDSDLLSSPTTQYKDTPEAEKQRRDDLMETDGDDPDDLDEPFEGWSRSPSPGIDKQEHQLDEFKDWDAANEIDVEGEAGEFARFVSHVKGKDLDAVREEIDQEINELNRMRKTHQRDSEEVTQAMIAQIMMLLRLFGIPYITAPMEAEAQCAALLSMGLVDGVITDDSDVFLFGATRVFKNMFNQSKTVECFLATDLQRELNLDRDKLIRLAYLLGSDYVDGLPGVGPVVAMELLNEFDSMEGVGDGLHRFREWWQKVQTGKDRDEDTQSDFKKRFKKKFKSLHLPSDWPNPIVRDAYYHPTVDQSEEPFKWGLPDLDALRTLLNDELRWSQSKVDDLLLPIIRTMGERSRKMVNRQGTLTGYFDASGGFGSGTLAPRKRQPYASKRLQQVVNEYRKKKDGPSRSATPSGSNSKQDENEDGHAEVKKSTSKRGKRQAKSKTELEAVPPPKKRRRLDARNDPEKEMEDSGEELDAHDTVPDRPLSVNLRARKAKPSSNVVEDGEDSG